MRKECFTCSHFITYCNEYTAIKCDIFDFRRLPLRGKQICSHYKDQTEL